MENKQENNTDIDPSGLFGTYKSHPVKDDVIEKNILTSHPETIYSLSEKKKNERNLESDLIKIVRIIVEGCVRIMKTVMWSIAILGGLFVTALATNTIDRAINIINKNIGTNLVTSGEAQINTTEVAENIFDTKPEKTSGMTSSALNTTTSTIVTEDAAAKRRAILEARKAARLLEEQRKSVDNTIQ